MTMWWTISATSVSSCKGDGLSYDIDGNILYAFVQDGGGFGTNYDAGDDRLVFTFEITNTTTGHFEFKLYDQLDHDPPGDDGDPPVLADQNFDLVDDVSGDVTTLHFGNVIQATDFDGDSVVLKDKVDIKVRDDVPELKDATPVARLRRRRRYRYRSVEGHQCR